MYIFMSTNSSYIKALLLWKYMNYFDLRADQEFVSISETIYEN